jgi:hypothetical protein
LQREGRRDLVLYPLTLPSPAKGEGKHNEMEKELPSPLRGEGGGDLGDYFTASGRGEGEGAMGETFGSITFAKLNNEPGGGVSPFTSE